MMGGGRDIYYKLEVNNIQIIFQYVMIEDKFFKLMLFSAKNVFFKYKIFEFKNIIYVLIEIFFLITNKKIGIYASILIHEIKNLLFPVYNRHIQCIEIEYQFFLSTPLPSHIHDRTDRFTNNS